MLWVLKNDSPIAADEPHDSRLLHTTSKYMLAGGRCYIYVVLLVMA